MHIYHAAPAAVWWRATGEKGADKLEREVRRITRMLKEDIEVHVEDAEEHVEEEEPMLYAVVEPGDDS